MAESMLALGGLALIAAAWFAQLLPLMSGKREINKNFVIVYAIGTALLGVDSVFVGNVGMAVLNFACVGLAGAVVFFASKPAPAAQA